MPESQSSHPALPQPSSVAKAKARFSASWDLLQRQQQQEAVPQIEQVGLPSPPGFVVWRIVGTRGCTVMPALVVGAPPGIRRAYTAKVIATLTAVCPICQQTAWINANAPDPETHPAGRATLEVSVGIEHLPGCRATFVEAHRKWFDPRALG
jgi:hypothetical protein